MRRRPDGLPPIKCHAKSKQSGKQCRNWATPGGLVCHYHGGGRGASKEAAARRLIEAELIDILPRRSRAEALADARHVSWLWMTQSHNRAAKSVLDGG